MKVVQMYLFSFVFYTGISDSLSFVRTPTISCDPSRYPTSTSSTRANPMASYLNVATVTFHNTLCNSRPTVISMKDDVFDDTASSAKSKTGMAENQEVFSMDEANLSEEMIIQLEENSPSQWEIMKDLLGINIFTYILAAMISVFLCLNICLGPGWLGQIIGFEGTGTFTQISDSLPDSVDLSQSDYLL